MTAVNHTGNNHGAGSRANSLEHVVRPTPETKLDQHKEHREEDDEHRRQRSIRYSVSVLYIIYVIMRFKNICNNAFCIRQIRVQDYI